MSADLCRNCGHYMPNAVGPGVYCANCGEPKEKPKPPKPKDVNQAHLTAYLSDTLNIMRMVRRV